jgi:hypothetical protein
MAVVRFRAERAQAADDARLCFCLAVIAAEESLRPSTSIRSGVEWDHAARGVPGNNPADRLFRRLP